MDGRAVVEGDTAVEAEAAAEAAAGAAAEAGAEEQGTRNKEQGTRNKEQGTRNDHENDICRLNDCQARRTSCQLYLCEVKFLRKAVGRGVLAELKEKCSRLAKPRHASVLPVLVHVNGVTEGVADSAFLARVIDFSRIVEAPTAAS